VKLLGFLRLLCPLTCGVGPVCRRWTAFGASVNEETGPDDRRSNGGSRWPWLLVFPRRNFLARTGQRAAEYLRHRRVCVPATAVLGVLELLGAVVGAVLALASSSDPALSLFRISSALTPRTFAIADRPSAPSVLDHLRGRPALLARRTRHIALEMSHPDQCDVQNHPSNNRARQARHRL
jgi:hypothetical protein